jgi:cobalt/nickel transport protein
MAGQKGRALMDNRKFILYGILIALIIGVVAVFLASADPDGLESTALVVQGQKTLTGGTPENAEIDEEHLGGTYSYSSLMPDYSLGEEMGFWGGIAAIVVGTFLSVVVVVGSLWAVKALSRPKEAASKP